MDASNQARTRNALAPLEFILSVTGTLMVLFSGVLAPIALLFGGEVSYYGLGDRSVCVNAPDNALSFTFTGNNPAHVDSLRPGVSAIPRQIELCDFHATTAQHLWSFLALFPPFLFAVVFVGYAWWLTRMARRRGLFSPDVALGVLRLGLFVLIGAVAVSCLRSYAEWRVLSSMAGDISRDNALFGLFHLSWSTLIGGFGLLTVGRIMAQSVRMQREIDATV
jgi:hypothetical protein